MEKHSLTRLFDPHRIWLLHTRQAADAALAQASLANWIADGRARVDIVTEELLDAAAAPLAADVVWLLMDLETVLRVLPVLGRWNLPLAVLSGAPATAEDAEQVLAVGRAHGVRLLGPDSLGLQRPRGAMNLSLLGSMPPSGTVAFLAQSGSLAASTLDWALDQGVGFSLVATVGAQRDIDMAEMLDFLTADSATESIVLYLEGVREPRSFLSALRAAATVKPVVVLKAGRHPETTLAAQTHSRALVGDDDVFDAALRRAGAVRVRFFVQLFSAVKCLASRYRPTGRRLAVVANGGGPGVLASDWAQESGLALAELSPETIAELGQRIPEATAFNPLDIGERVAADAFADAVRMVMDDPGVDGVLAMFAPKADRDPLAYAQGLVAMREQFRKPLIACWLGDRRVLESRALLARSRIPTFRTPEPAVDAFGNLASFYRHQQLSWQTPPALSEGVPPDVDGARLLLEHVRDQGRQVLTEMESKALLAAFHIPVARTQVTQSPQEATLVAQQIGFPVVLKISSPDVTHKSDVGGVMLDIRSARQLQLAWQTMMEGVRQRAPDARIDGIAVEPMIAPKHARELHIGVVTDPLFGPVILFGAGGRAIEIYADRAMELPPLNRFLARRLIERTRASRMLGEWRGAAAANIDAVEASLLRISELVCELPEIAEIDLNPLIVDEHGLSVVDARVVLKADFEASTLPYGHMAIMPYPTQLERECLMRDGSAYQLRAIRPEDAEALQAFVRSLSDETRYFRFVANVRELSPRQLARFTQIDYWREMALVAVLPTEAVDPEEHAELAVMPRFAGVARYMLNPDMHSCEFAIAIGDTWQSRGLGVQMMQALIDVARSRGLQRMEGMVIANNGKMHKLMQRLGFSSRPDPEDASMSLVSREL
jgi:acetyltransferase